MSTQSQDPADDVPPATDPLVEELADEGDFDQQDIGRLQRRMVKIAEKVSRDHIKELKKNGDVSVETDKGHRVSLSWLTRRGFHRRIAFGILFFLSMGLGWDQAVQRARAASSGNAGEPTDPLIAVYTGELSGAGIPVEVTDHLDMKGNDITNAGSVATDEVTFKEALDTQVTASEGTSYNIDVSAGNYHKVTLTGDVDFDFTNVDGTDVNSVVLHLVQDGTGGRSPSFTTPTVVWDGGSAPSWSTGANEEDIVTFIHDQDGSQWVGFVGGLTLG